MSDEGKTRYYLDPVSGSVLQRADTNGRWDRWLFGGLHRIDFTSWLRARPMWDLIVLSLMLGGLALTASGLYLAVRRIRNDIVMLFRLTRNRPAGVFEKRSCRHLSAHAFSSRDMSACTHLNPRVLPER